MRREAVADEWEVISVGIAATSLSGLSAAQENDTTQQFPDREANRRATRSVPLELDARPPSRDRQKREHAAKDLSW